MTYRVRVEKESLRFAAAHMATFAGDLEPLHGHNYALTVEVEGALTADAWVIDFGDLKAIARDLCKRLDHRFLLQGASNLLDVGEADGVVRRRVRPTDATHFLQSTLSSFRSTTRQPSASRSGSRVRSGEN